MSRIRFDKGMLQGPSHPRAPRSPRPPRGGWILLPSPLWGRGWRASGVIASRGGPGEGVSPFVNSYVGHYTNGFVRSLFSPTLPPAPHGHPGMGDLSREQTVVICSQGIFNNVFARDRPRRNPEKSQGAYGRPNHDSLSSYRYLANQ